MWLLLLHNNFLKAFRELIEVLSLNDLMYKYFCNLSLSLKFLFFGFTGYNMPMIKASKIWNKQSLSPSVILVKRPVCLCLNPPSITCTRGVPEIRGKVP